jgi:arginyl-tRNA synthetase
MSRSAVQELAGPVEAAIAEVGGDGVQARLERPADPAHGDYATAAALQLAKPLRAAPRQIAERIVERIDSPFIASAEVAGPGFVNLRATPAWSRHVVERVLDEGRRYGAGAAATPQKVQVEYVSGNPTGPVTASTARNAAYGDSLARLFEFAGHDVQREYYFNDAGRQMDLFGASLRARARGEDVPEDGYQGAYIEEIARDLGLDPDAPADEWRAAGVAVMVEDIKRTLGRFRAGFDRWFLERSLYEDGSVDRAIEAVREGGHTYEKDGALWLRSEELGDDKDRVLVRSDGTPTYIAGDLGYIVSKLGRGFDVAVYVLGADHHGYIGRLMAMCACFGDIPGEHLQILIGQMVNLVKDGQPVRMSKRAGNVVVLEDLVDAVGVDAARYQLARSSADSTLEIDLDLLVRASNDNPVHYVQYAHARTANVIKNAEAVGITLDTFVPELLDSETETALLTALGDFPRVVAQAAVLHEPHRVARYLEELAGYFHRWYDNCRVIPRGDEPVTDVNRTRLWLDVATKTVLANGLGLLGVSAPDRK